MKGLDVYAESGETKMWGTLVSDMQTGVAVTNGTITGTLKYLESGEPATTWGAGNFLCLKFANLDPEATSVKVGLDPSEGSGLVELLGDPDMNGAFKITDKDTQVFKVVTSTSKRTTTQTFDLKGLEVENS